MTNTYIIGEIGQNHNGSVDIAKLIVDLCLQPVKDNFFNRELKPMDAVKLTKRDLKEELTQSQMDQPYTSAHSFGKTYGEHRAALELSDEEHYEVYKHAKAKGADFIETLCSIGCLSILKYFSPDRLKVASRDLTNLPLLNALAETKIPIILSTGMGGEEELEDALAVITRHHEQISILHCLSEYPSDYQNLNLKSIPFLQKKYSNYTIGYSDHSIGIMVPTAAVALGARIIEKHVTLDRNMKGSDHAGSVEKDGIYRMVRDIRNLENSLGEEKMFRSEASASSSIKLERSVASLRPIAQGETITEADLHLLSPGNGIKWKNRDIVVGKKAVKDIAQNELIYPEDVA